MTLGWVLEVSGTKEKPLAGSRALLDPKRPLIPPPPQDPRSGPPPQTTPWAPPWDASGEGWGRGFPAITTRLDFDVHRLWNCFTSMSMDDADPCHTPTGFVLS